tara:strand:+ start:231 stop:479 length:249 start_codon:yes stop_codon:yes gene_type:complete
MGKTINELNQIIRWPKKPSDKKNVIQWLSQYFDFDIQYSEKEVNQIINHHHNFNDIPLLRRELISQKYLDRKKDGSIYWRIN